MVQTQYSYTMEDGYAVAKRATNDIDKYLRSKIETLKVTNVEDDPDYREKDIDLIWEFQKDGVIKK